MNRTKEIRDIKAAVARFQEETKSNSVLDFVTWIENQFCKLEQEKELYKKRRFEDDN